MSHRPTAALVSLAAVAALSAAALGPAAGSTDPDRPTVSQLAPSSSTRAAVHHAATAVHHARAAVHHARPASAPPSTPEPTASERALRDYGYLVPHPAAYARAKTRAAARFLGPQSAGAASLLAPVQQSNFAGVRDNSGTPSDSTGAVGPTRYLETVNRRFGLYDRTNTLIGSGTLNALVGGASLDNVFDPQVIWDPGTNRFYYAADQITERGTNLLAFGFSKTASPNGAAGFCKYRLSYGAVDFPDFPKLGDTRDFFVIGVNVFSPSRYTGSDIIAVTKPETGPTCPAKSTLGIVKKTDVKSANGSRAFTPVPANQIDTSGTGWVVARSIALPASFLSIFRITRNRTTGAAVISRGWDVAVPSYTVPPNAPQRGASQLLDTSDARNTQAVSAVDPVRGGMVGLWTQHTVRGGAGAEVRWYEIDPVAKTVLQRGEVTSSTLFNFNGAISPDRRVLGATTAFGSNMVMNFNTSSARTFPAIKVVSKVRRQAQSAPVTVVRSVGPNIDFVCPNRGDVCRWGDYAAATPDPAAPSTGLTGVVFGTSQYNRDGRLRPHGVNWLTRNFSFTP